MKQTRRGNKDNEERPRLKAANRRFKDVESEPLYATATLLDPRHKDTEFFFVNVCVRERGERESVWWKRERMG